MSVLLENRNLMAESRYYISPVFRWEPCLLKLMATRGTEKDAEEEQIHFQKVITAIQKYAPYTVCPCALTHHAAVLKTWDR